MAQRAKDSALCPGLELTQQRHLKTFYTRTTMRSTDSIGYGFPASFPGRLSAADWLYALALLAGSLFALNRYGHNMDYYEQAILVLAAPTFAWLGWHWQSVRCLMALLAVLSLWAVSLYAGSLEMANTKFFLKYMLSSQSAILWMSMLFFLSTLFYWGGLVSRSDFGTAIGSKLCW